MPFLFDLSNILTYYLIEARKVSGLSYIIFEEYRMKRQKRDRLERAYSKGYQAGTAGRSNEVCPFQSADSRGQWLGGWREAQEIRGTGLFMK